jgi:hypothetical protein
MFRQAQRSFQNRFCGNNSEKMKTLCWFFLGMGRMERFVVPTDLNSFVQSKIYGARKKAVRRKGKNEGIPHGEAIPRLESHFQQAIPPTSCHDSRTCGWIEFMI